MLVRNLTLSGTRSEHTVRVSTIYQFVTVFNHSDYVITVFPENLTNEREKHYRVPPRIYLTLPLLGAGMVESCQREVVYTVVSEGVSMPSTVIGLTFTEENNNINMPFPDASIPAPTLDRRLFGGSLFSGVVVTAISKMIINSLYIAIVASDINNVTLSHRHPGMDDVILLTSVNIPVGTTLTLGYIVLERGDSLVASNISGFAHISIYGLQPPSTS